MQMLQTGVQLLLSLSVVLFNGIGSAHAEPNLSVSKIHVNMAPTENLSQLVDRAEIIATCKIRSDDTVQPFPTHRTVSGKRVFNYVQSVHIEKQLKGNSPEVVRLLTVGLEPLPKPSDPLNQVYTGPLAEGKYVLFLQKVADINDNQLFTLIGSWQGVYPVIRGKIIALKNAGYPQLDGMTTNELEQKLKQKLS